MQNELMQNDVQREYPQFDNFRLIDIKSCNDVSACTVYVLVAHTYTQYHNMKQTICNSTGLLYNNCKPSPLQTVSIVDDEKPLPNGGDLIWIIQIVFAAFGALCFFMFCLLCSWKRGWMDWICVKCCSKIPLVGRLSRFKPKVALRLVDIEAESDLL